MKFDIFGRKTLEVVRHNGQWLAFYSGSGGVKRKAHDLQIPDDIDESQVDDYIADIFHEWATLDQPAVKRLG